MWRQAIIIFQCYGIIVIRYFKKGPIQEGTCFLMIFNRPQTPGAREFSSNTDGRNASELCKHARVMSCLNYFKLWNKLLDDWKIRLVTTINYFNNSTSWVWCKINAFYSLTDGRCSFKGARMKTEAHLGNHALQGFKFNGSDIRAKLKSIFGNSLTQIGETGTKPSQAVYSHLISTQRQKNWRAGAAARPPVAYLPR